MAAIAPAPVSLPAAEPAPVASPPGVDPAASGLLNGTAAPAAAPAAVTDLPVTPTKAPIPPPIDDPAPVATPAVNPAVNGSVETTVTTYNDDSIFGTPSKKPIPLVSDSSEWYVTQAITGLFSFGLGYKAVLEDIYRRIKEYEKYIPDPEKTRLQLELQRYNLAVRAYNGSCEGINEPLRPLKMLYKDSPRGAWKIRDIPSMPKTIADLDNPRMTEAKYIQILDECRCTNVRIPGTNNKASILQGDRSHLRRQARKALGLAPFPLSIA